MAKLVNSTRTELSPSSREEDAKVLEIVALFQGRTKKKQRSAVTES